MYPPERQRAITQLLVDVGGRVDVARIRKTLGVTHETVRRDLDVLERRGVLRRVHGGAELLQETPFEQALAARHAEQRAEKLQIAKRLVTEIPTDGVIALDSGSLSYVIAQALPADRSLVVVTNNLPVAQLLADRPALKVITLPGTIRGLTTAVVDSATRRRLETLTVDVSIIGVNGLSPQRGLTTTTPEESAVKRAMLLSARRRIVPVISGRVGRNSFCTFAELSEVDLIITDAGANPDVLAELATAGPEIVVAADEGTPQ
ncbi:DeoR/GlpR family DNA-binding transcription regulator [Propionibacteriaceae bacterium Y1685]|uniref:DeoR/GlpR family DNA-binding transcription regulator n=1 Tax=Microlunatus sp. Y1700 TaxID=3418487 RepID=UPI003B772DEA